jgi:hypothetical protein
MPPEAIPFIIIILHYTEDGWGNLGRFRIVNVPRNVQHGELLASRLEAHFPVENELPIYLSQPMAISLELFKRTYMIALRTSHRAIAYFSEVEVVEITSHCIIQ